MHDSDLSMSITRPRLGATVAAIVVPPHMRRFRLQMSHATCCCVQELWLLWGLQKGMTPLLRACAGGRLTLAQWLVVEAGSDARLERDEVGASVAGFQSSCYCFIVVRPRCCCRYRRRHCHRRAARQLCCTRVLAVTVSWPSGSFAKPAAPTMYVTWSLSLQCADIALLPSQGNDALALTSGAVQHIVSCDILALAYPRPVHSLTRE